jgi:hypothetical protein
MRLTNASLVPLKHKLVQPEGYTHIQAVARPTVKITDTQLAESPGVCGCLAAGVTSMVISCSILRLLS